MKACGYVPDRTLAEVHLSRDQEAGISLTGRSSSLTNGVHPIVFSDDLA